MPKAVIASPSEACDCDRHDGQNFHIRYRLRKTDDYSSVFAFRKAYKGRYFYLHWRPNTLIYPRLGVIVAKKLAKQAVVRNLIKRIAREQFRKKRANISAFDIIIRLRAPVTGVTRKMLNEDLAQLFGKLR